ncbi:hypothetical protein [Williamsia herbipolensis]|uniref:hypothetical protein n=1 Tax=Williamsia herbipolensis TaxID=1603258 RepID=UPI0005F8988E|nr:hypothetical protein [Williamsia herbipolensis]
MSHPHEHEDRELVTGMQKGISTVTSIATQLVQALQRRMQLAEQRRRAELAALRAEQKPLVHRDLGTGDLQARWAAAHAVATAARADAEQARADADAARETHGETHAEYRAADVDASRAEGAADTAEMWAEAWDDRAHDAGVGADITSGALADVEKAQSSREPFDPDTHVYDPEKYAYRVADTGHGAAALEYAGTWDEVLNQDQPARSTGDLLADTRPDPNAAATDPGQWAGNDTSAAGPHLELASSTSQGPEL